jgi:PPOX class probable F420-dependent enzyme
MRSSRRTWLENSRYSSPHSEFFGKLLNQEARGSRQLRATCDCLSSAFRVFLLNVADARMSSISDLSPSALRFIRIARLAHLASADVKGQPHVIPVCFVFDGKYFYSPIDEKPKRTTPVKLKRVRNLQENAQTALVIDRYSEDWKNLAYVLVYGTAKILYRGAAHAGAARRLRRKYPQYRHMAIHSRPMIQIRPVRWIFWGKP